MRILHISEAFGGGLRTALCNFVSAAGPDDSHTVFVRTRDGHDTIDLPPSAVVNVFTGSIPRFLVEATKVATRGHFDVVHLHSSYAGLLRLSLPPGQKIVYSPHCYAMTTDAGWLTKSVYFVTEKGLSRRKQMLLAVSPDEQEIGRHLNRSMLSVVVPNAAPITGLAADSSTTSASGDDRRVIAMMGRLSAQKDPAFFADVVKHLDPRRFRAVWIGEGDLHRQELLDLGVEITGWLTPPETAQRLAAADLYVHVAAWEGGPLAPLEAAAVDTPVVSRTIPSMESLGYFTVGTDPGDVANQIAAFFDDPSVRELVIERTRELTQRYSFENMSGELRSAYSLANRALGPLGEAYCL